VTTAPGGRLTAEQLAEIDRVLAGLDADALHWVPLGPPDQGRRVSFTQPEEADFFDFREGVTIEHVCRYVTGWEGFTEATLRGAAVGASDPLPFDVRLWRRYARNHADEASVVARAIADAIKQRVHDRELGAKN
jgi:hypothetical protein